MKPFVCRGERLIVLAAPQDKVFTSLATKVVATLGDVMKHAPCGVLYGLRPAAPRVRCRRACRRTCGRAVVGVPLRRRTACRDL